MACFSEAHGCLGWEKTLPYGKSFHFPLSLKPILGKNEKDLVSRRKDCWAGRAVSREGAGGEKWAR